MNRQFRAALWKALRQGEDALAFYAGRVIQSGLELDTKTELRNIRAAIAETAAAIDAVIADEIDSRIDCTCGTESEPVLVTEVAPAAANGHVHPTVGRALQGLVIVGRFGPAFGGAR